MGEVGDKAIARPLRLVTLFLLLSLTCGLFFEELIIISFVFFHNCLSGQFLTNFTYFTERVYLGIKCKVCLIACVKIQYGFEI